ncbi:MAG TPA: hypothetical protein VGQ83_36745 [Polyangia bacterium]|jgi:hypothetical protein
MSESAARRLLLLEFLLPNRYSHVRSKNYPFFQGQARALGIPALWLCCWGPSGLDSRSCYVIELGEAERAALLDAIAAFAPTHVVLSERLGAELARQLRARFPAVVVEDGAEAPFERLVRCAASWLPAWLGLEAAGAPPDGYLVDVVTPAFESRLVPSPGAPPPAAAPLHIEAGPECQYKRPLARNRFFRDLALPPGVRACGCSFCFGPGDLPYHYATPPVELALRQCRLALATPDRATAARDFVIDGTAVALRIGRFLGRVLADGFPPSRFFFSFRVDELLGVARQIEPLLPELARAGHSINVYNLGVENFSPDENDRLNKGLTPEQIDRCFELAIRWERAYPGTFCFSQHGGYSIILFTPWTTIPDLEINLERMRRTAIPAPAFALTSKLQAIPGAPLTELARRDGLLAESPAAFHYYDSGCFFFADQREVPWRFRRPEIAELYRFACRVQPMRPFPPDDALAGTIQELQRERRDLWPDALALFAAAVAEVAADPTASAEQVLARLRQRCAATPAPRPRPPTPDATEALLAELEARLRPAPAPAQLGGFHVRSLGAGGGSYVVVALERPAGAGAPERVDVHVERRGHGQRFYLAAGDLTVAYSDATPLDSPAKQTAVRGLAAALRRRGRPPR